METALGTGPGPVVDDKGRPHRSLNQFDPGPGRDEPDPTTEAAGPSGSGAPGSTDRPARRRPSPRRVGRTALLAVVPIALLLVWHLATEVTGRFAPYQLPAPLAVWDAGVELATWQNGPNLADHVLISTQRVLLGFALGALLGLAVGAAVGLSRLADTLFSGTLGAVRAVPSLAWVPLLILWIGINEDSKVALIAIGAFFPVFTTVAGALRHVDPHLVEAGRAYGLRGVPLLLRVQLPAATPGVVSGLRLALAQAWLFLVAAELIASSRGLGFLLMDSANNGRVDRILLAILILAVLGKTTDSLIGIGERKVLRRW